MTFFTRLSVLISLTSLAYAGVADASKRRNRRRTAEEPPPLGWYQPEGAVHACYYPASLDEVQGRARTLAVVDAMNEVVSQWRGQLNDGVEFSPNAIDDVYNAFLARPERGEFILSENLQYCQQAATSRSTSDWNSWMRSLPDILQQDLCLQPLDYSLYQWLNLDNIWQEERPVCPDDHIIITGTRDRYRIVEDGPWITVEGDPDSPTVGMDLYPCSFDGCYEGMLILRYVTDNGVEQIFPIGTEFVYRVPEAGTISFAINDLTAWDNSWGMSRGATERVQVRISPVE